MLYFSVNKTEHEPEQSNPIKNTIFIVAQHLHTYFNPLTESHLEK